VCRLAGRGTINSLTFSSFPLYVEKVDGFNYSFNVLLDLSANSSYEYYRNS